jgi:hypothetical protein
LFFWQVGRNRKLTHVRIKDFLSRLAHRRGVPARYFHWTRGVWSRLAVPVGGPIGGEFGWSRTAISTAVSVMMLCTAFSLPLMRRLVDRFGVKRILTAGNRHLRRLPYTQSDGTGYHTLSPSERDQVT